MWQITVTELLLIFRDALASLVPHVERAKIEWRQGLAYDDWDEIAQVLYDKFVVASLRWAIHEVGHEDLQMPTYDTAYTSYADKVLLIVSDKSSPRRLVFQSFTTTVDPFDTVCAREIDAQGNVISDQFMLLSASGVSFAFELANRRVDAITVEV